jgi:hypothetical protein
MTDSLLFDSSDPGKARDVAAILETLIARLALGGPWIPALAVSVSERHRDAARPDRGEVALAEQAAIKLDFVALERDFRRPEPRPLSPPLGLVAG